MTLHEHALRGALPRDLHIVDVHGHGGPWSDFLIHEPWVEGMLRTMDASGIARVLFAPHLGIGPDAEESNRLAARMAMESNGRLLPYCAVNPNRPMREIRALLEEYLESGLFVGVKLHPSLHRQSIHAAGYAAVLECADRLRAPILVHTWHDCPYCGPAELCRAAARYPKARFIMGHSGGTPAGMDRAVHAAAGVPNVWLETSGSRTPWHAIEKLVGGVGESRVLFGTDMPFLDPRPKLGQVLFANISDQAKRAVLGLNAIEVFGAGAVGP